MTDLTFRTAPRKVAGGSIQRANEFYDVVFEAGAITIDQDAYSAGLDRTYDVRGFKNMHIEITNTGSNPLTYKIEKARKNFTLLTTLSFTDFNKDIQGNTDVLANVAASGTVTLASVLAADTVTINGLVYTAVAGVKSDNTEFSIDGTDTVDAADLVDSMINDTRQGTLADLIPSNVLGVVTLFSTAGGTAGNAVTLVSSDGTRLAVSGATFAGGVDNFSIKDIVDISPESTAIRIRIRRKTSGQSTILAGFVSVN